MSTQLLHKTIAAFQLTLDLVTSIEASFLHKKLPNLKSNKIGQQFWCIIGARESYIKAIENEKWIGFSCSLENSFSKEEIITKLNESALKWKQFEGNELSEKQKTILLDLYTHEIQHHGQLIRFCYALEIKFPKSWNNKYTV